MVKLAQVLSVCVLVTALGCGGGDKKKETTPTATNSTDDPAPKPRPVEISSDKLTEIDALLKRKRDTVTRCFAEAMEAKEVTKNDRGSVTVHFTIGMEGKATAARIGEHTIKSAVLHQCVLTRVKRWSFPVLPKPLDYSYSFGFAPF